MAGSTRSLSGGSMADPAEVSFSRDGALLVVTEKATNLIDVYVVGTDGVAGPPISNPSAGMTPFGFAFDQRNHLIVSEAFGGAPNASTVSSYAANLSGMLSVISESVPDFQTAACWIVITNSGRYVYTSNTGSGSVSSYTLDSSGTLTLLNSVAANIGAMSAPIDMALNNGSCLLYTYMQPDFRRWKHFEWKRMEVLHRSAALVDYHSALKALPLGNWKDLDHSYSLRPFLRVSAFSAINDYFIAEIAESRRDTTLCLVNNYQIEDFYPDPSY